MKEHQQLYKTADDKENVDKKKSSKTKKKKEDQPSNEIELLRSSSEHQIQTYPTDFPLAHPNQ